MNLMFTVSGRFYTIFQLVTVLIADSPSHIVFRSTSFPFVLFQKILNIILVKSKYILNSLLLVYFHIKQLKTRVLITFAIFVL